MDSGQMLRTMKAIVYILVIMLGSARTDLPGECDMAGFYLELGCTPVPRTEGVACPDAFQCPDLHPDPSMCYYRGVPYGDRSTIPQAQIKNPCSQACRCLVTDEPRFECAAVDCVEVFNGDKQECVRTYEPGACCSSETVCGKDAIAKLKTCEVDGQVYKEGETFEPKDTRKTCVCSAEWNGSTDDEASCRDIDCGLEIHYQENIMDKCAPIFAGNKRSCPIGFTCPTASPKVTRGLNIRGVNSQCAFGNLTLGVGDKVTAAETCATCECVVPPFVSCTMMNPCPAST